MKFCYQDRKIGLDGCSTRARGWMLKLHSRLHPVQKMMHWTDSLKTAFHLLRYASEKWNVAIPKGSSSLPLMVVIMHLIQIISKTDGSLINFVAILRNNLRAIVYSVILLGCNLKFSRSLLGSRCNPECFQFVVISRRDFAILQSRQFRRESRFLPQYFPSLVTQVCRFCADVS
jgi:hypothetical protein